MKKRFITCLIFQLLVYTGCFLGTKPEYVPPPPSNPYPKTIFGHNAEKEFLPVGMQALSLSGDRVRLVKKMTVRFDRNQFMYYGREIPVLSHQNPEKLGGLDLIFLGIYKSAPVNKIDNESSEISELRAEQVCIRVFRHDGIPYNEKEYKEASFNSTLKYDKKRNMLKAGENMIIAIRKQKVISE